MKKLDGFTLVEILVVMGILSVLIAGASFIGFPEYNRYIVYSERDYLVDTLLESRARSLASGEAFVVSTWSNGYCIKDVSDLCIGPVHDLPANMSLHSIDLATSTKIILGNTLQVEINLDQNGFINRQ